MSLEARIKGWKKRGVWDDPKLTEILKMYQELGFMVRLEPFNPETKAGCSTCMEKSPEKYRVLYTKNSDNE